LLLVVEVVLEYQVVAEQVVLFYLNLILLVETHLFL
jgi:hypothetical protein|tara:strand:+ start:143 stop:250 length:108 start_codon:yes stop_codon:yes gene_type:complete